MNLFVLSWKYTWSKPLSAVLNVLMLALGLGALAFILLGCIFNLNGMLWCHLLAFSTAYASRKVRLPARLGRWLNRLMGGLFVGLGIKLAAE